jgi:hypothetical protein
MKRINDSVKAQREALANKLLSEGKDINDTANIGNEDYDNYHLLETQRATAISNMEATDRTKTADILSRSGSRSPQIVNLETTSNRLKGDIETKTSTLDPKIRRRDYARKEEGHEKLEILKQKAKNLKDQADYNAGGFTGFINNAETLSKSLDRIARTDNPQEIENLRKAVSELQRDGKLTEEQAKQIEGNLTKGKSDQEKAVAQILEAIKAGKAT